MPEIEERHHRSATATSLDGGLLATVARSTPCILWGIDRDGRILLSEGGGLAALGSVPGEVVGLSAFDLYGHNPEVLTALHRALAGDTFSMTIETGGRAFQTHYAPLRNSAGQMIGTTGVSVDVTLRRQAANGTGRAREETIKRLARAVEERSLETGGHIERVSRVCALLARRLGLDGRRCELIRIATPMHDLGKIAIPEHLLLKPAQLIPSERRIVQRHAEIGASILNGSAREELQMGATIAWTHHERFDGTGYPRGLAREAIPLEGRIAAVGDVFDALTHDRVYRPAIPVEEALEIMAAERGRHFDPDVLDEFFCALDEIAGIMDRIVAVTT